MEQAVAQTVSVAHEVPSPTGSAPAVPSSASPEIRPRSEHSWRYSETAFGRIDVVIRVPEHRAGARLPLLVAFHGRGESLKGPERGARGWLDDYRLERAAERLSEPPLSKEDFEGAVTGARLEALNRELALEPYRDLVVAMPYLPDVLGKQNVFPQGEVLAAFVSDELLPRLRSELPVRSEPAHTGIDGVSLGGRAALIVGFLRPKEFGSVGALQPAIDEQELPRWVELAGEARRANPTLGLRLLTSHEDYYREVVTDLAALLDRAGVRNRFDLVSGNHSYAFNRGPGSIEMLLHHSRELWRASRPAGGE